MNINDKFKEMIVREIDFVVQNIEKTSKVADRLYYFSAIHAILNRIYNIEFDPELVYIHFIVQATHKAFLQRLQAIQQGGESTIPLTDTQLDKLTSILKELGEKIKNNEDLNDTLKKFVILSYTTTGNGYYLMKKGTLEI